MGFNSGFKGLNEGKMKLKSLGRHCTK